MRTLLRWPSVLAMALLNVSLTQLSVDGLASGPLPPMDFVHRAIMDQRGAYVFLWSPLEDEIVIEVQVATRGYVGLGFSPTGGMKGADIVIGWVDHLGRLHFQDRYAVARLTPRVDSSQDYKLLGGYQNSSHTVFRFSRPWTTCDHLHDFQLTGDTVRVIWAYDEEDPGSTERMARHDHRGTKSLYLREPRMISVPQGDDIQHWDVLSPDLRLPDDLPTLYWCKLYKVPSLRTKTHVIGYLPLIKEANRQHVHHMVLFECHLSTSERYLEKFVAAPGAQCYDRNMPVSWSACNTPIVAWAIGSEGAIFPEHVGIPLGEEHGGSTYFLLEIHYDNPNLRRGVTDNSGLRLLHTENLRQYDAGVLQVGHTVSPTHIIPPGQMWSSLAHCTSDCTEALIPPEGIKIFQGFLHAHLLGTAITIKQIHRGREMPMVFKDMSYDFNYQQSRLLKEEMVILPGDSLITECTYDSTKRKLPTIGGFSTEEEMCLGFLTYYPRVNLSGCYSRPDMALVFDAFGIQDLFNNDMNVFDDIGFSENYINEEDENANLATMMTEGTRKTQNILLADIFRTVIIKAPEKYFNKSFYDVLYDKATWQDPELISTLQERVKYERHHPSCEAYGRVMVEGLPKKVKYPDYISIEPLEEKCTQSLPDTEVYVPEVKSTAAPPPVIRKSNDAQQDQQPSPTSPPAASSPSVPQRPDEENEIERDSYTQKDQKDSAPQAVPCTYLLTIFFVIISVH